MTQKDNHVHLAFNRGMLSPLGLARIDLKRTALSAEIQTNWIPRVLGSAMLRPGLEYIGGTKDNNVAVDIPFVFSQTDTASLEFTEDVMRIWIDDELLTRPTVSTAITNGLFTTDLTGWTDNDEAGATSFWATGNLVMRGNSTGTAYCIRDQQVTVGAPDIGVEHALRILVLRGDVEVKVGSTLGGQEYWGYSLGVGTHSLSVTPAGDLHIRIRSRASYAVILASIVIESSGIVEIGTDRDADDLSKLRHDQSGDIIFIACAGKRQTKVERRATRSWSWVNYEADQGPFLTQNLGATTLLPSALFGDVTLTASAPLFEQGHVSALFSITSTVQNVTAENIAAEDTWSDPIVITGVGDARLFVQEVTGVTGTGTTVMRQRSLSEPGAWEDGTEITVDATATKDDGLDNQTVYYRIGVKTGDYSSGTPTASLLSESGSITGICRITAVTNETTATASVLQNFGSSTVATSDWSEGQWSIKRGYPTAVGFHEGRLFWAGKDKINGSISDSFYNFDPEYEGDAAPINRSIGQGPVDVINWLSSGKTLLIGCEGAVKTVRSSSLDEPLTVSNLSIKDIVTQGSAALPSIKIDNEVLFVQASGIRLYDVGFSSTTFDYNNIDLTSIVPEIGEPSIIKIVVQRQPDTRVHAIRSDGKVALLIFDKVEDVKCWVLVETDGLIEDAVVLPGATEDQVYYTVNRTIGGNTVRYREKWTLESENKGDAITKLADSHLIYSGVSTDTITGLGHLEGESVIVWGDTKDLGTYTVTSAEITLSESVTWCCVGLVYQADFKSAKPALATAHGSSLLQKKFISQLGLLLADTYAQGISCGPDFDHLDDLPPKEDGVAVGDDEVIAAYDEEPFDFPGTWDSDARLCLRAVAPRPCTLLAAVIEWNTNEKV